MDLVELKGQDLVQVFEQVASMYDKTKPSDSFLQVSGIFSLYSEDDRKPDTRTQINKQTNKYTSKQKANRQARGGHTGEQTYTNKISKQTNR